MYINESFLTGVISVIHLIHRTSSLKEIYNVIDTNIIKEEEEERHIIKICAGH
jgi:hypothetical protein